MFRELRIITAGRLRYTTHSNKVTERAMKTRAAVAFEAKKPLEIVEVDLEGPKTGEVLGELMANGICPNDAYNMDWCDLDVIYLRILGSDCEGNVREGRTGD